MKLFAAVLVVCVAFASAEFKDKTEDDFFKASKACAEKLKVPAEYLEKFANFDYPDVEIVHKQIECVFTDLELWNSETGYNVEHIAALYKDKASSEELIPILNNCNKKNGAEPNLPWLYRGFQCIMGTKVGGYFKEDIAKQAAKAQN